MAGLSRPKDGVASARLCPAIHVLAQTEKGVDARDKPGHDVDRVALYASNLTAVCPSHPG